MYFTKLETNSLNCLHNCSQLEDLIDGKFKTQINKLLGEGYLSRMKMTY